MINLAFFESQKLQVEPPSGVRLIIYITNFGVEPIISGVELEFKNISDYHYKARFSLALLLLHAWSTATP